MTWKNRDLSSLKKEKNKRWNLEMIIYTMILKLERLKFVNVWNGNYLNMKHNFIYM